MQKAALDRFRIELNRWISAHNEEKGLQTNADEHIGTDPESSQMPCKPIGSKVELPIREARPLELQGDGVGRLLHLLFE